jgi:uncharacterized protein with NRDE domain
MCTFIMAWQVFGDAPVVVAANRDERLDRPSQPPSVLAEDPRIIAPQDEEAGGTWIGYNEHGVLVAILNRWTDADLRGERSRGLLVMDALEHESATDAAAIVESAIDEHEYEGFNLIVADKDAAILYEWDEQLRTTGLEPGVHIVVNVGADDHFEIPEFRSEPGHEQAENTRQARADLRPESGETADAWLDRATAVLRDHDYGFCVHQGQFGTRSSSLINISDDGTVHDRFADGPPCETDYDVVDIHL